MDTAKEDLSIVATATKEETSCFDGEEEKVDLSLNDSPEVVIKNMHMEGAEQDTVT